MRTRVEPVLLARRPARSRFLADCPELEGAEREDEQEDEQKAARDDAPVVVEEPPENRVPAGPLALADVPIGRPLPWRMVDITGELLLDTGAVLPHAAARALLFQKFQPVCERPVEGASPVLDRSGDDATAQQLSVTDMGLAIGSRLGVRNTLGGAMATYASRMIGITPGELIFITVPTSSAGRLALDAREMVEVVAISPRTIYLFVCQVEAVCVAPAPYIILSKPRVIRRLRERRAERLKVRFPVLYSGARPAGGTDAPAPGDTSGDGLGIAQDLSDLGMALATLTEIAALGDTVKVRFYLDMHLSTVCVEASGTVRNVRALTDDNEEHSGYEYGLEFVELPVASKLALRNFVLSRRETG